MRNPTTAQQRALHFVKDLDQCGIFLEMRLGKTLVAIRWALRKFKESGHGITGRVLVVAPVSVCGVWVQELQKEGENSTAFISDGDGYLHQRWCLTSYEWFQRNHAQLSAASFLVVIVDESIRIKNPRAKITKALTRWASDVPYRCILSGCPNPESELDLFSQIYFLRQTAWLGAKNYWVFRTKHFIANRFEWSPRSGLYQAIRRSLKSDCIFLSRKDAGMNIEKVREKRYVKMTTEQCRKYRDAVKEYVIQGEPVNQAIQVYSYCRTTAGSSDSKDCELAALLKGELKKDPVVIWYVFHRQRKHISRTLTKLSIAFGLIRGSTSRAERKNIGARFAAGHYHVLVVQIRTAKHGLDFSHSSTAIYYGNSPSLDDRIQSEDRLIHPRKSESCLYVDLLSKNTVEEDIYRGLIEKKCRSNIIRQMWWREERKRAR